MELWPKYFVILLGETVLLDTLIANSLTFALEVECYSSVQKNASILSLCYGIFWECHRSWSSRVCGWRRGRLCHLCSQAGHLWVDGYLISQRPSWPKIFSARTMRSVAWRGIFGPSLTMLYASRKHGMGK